MGTPRRPFTILIAEDDEDDYLLTLEALKEAGVNNKVRWVKDGEELMEVLKTGVPNGNGKQPDIPGMILLDLNMPKKDGREALAEIKSHPALRKIPVIVLTTSNAENDITHSYDLGVNSFIQKPVRFHDLVGVIKVLSNYWLKTVKLPQ
ncbi:MAG: response regulator [Nitrospinaceae bacterium]